MNIECTVNGHAMVVVGGVGAVCQVCSKRLSGTDKTYDPTGTGGHRPNDNKIRILELENKLRGIK